MDHFIEDFTSTIGIDFSTKTRTLDFPLASPNSKRYKVVLQIWDTAGQERFQTLLPNYVKAASVVILVFSLTDPNSLQRLEEWAATIPEIESKGVVLVGNKSDLPAVVSVDVYSAFQKKHNIEHFFATSAKTNAQIEELFDRVFEAACEVGIAEKNDADKRKEAETQVQLEEVNEEKSFWCC